MICLAEAQKQEGKLETLKEEGGKEEGRGGRIAGQMNDWAERWRDRGTEGGTKREIE